MSVEVERKFVCNADTVKTLEEIGAVCLAQREFKDQYFDSPTFDLTLRDVWLRKRKGCWELKCPASAGETEEASGGPTGAAAALCSRYREITDLPQIQQRVREELRGDGERSAYPPADDDDDDEESWPSGMNLGCFAEFTTVRRSFALEEDGVQVDLDQADFGYSVGEIEVLVPEGGDVQSALEKIGRTARKLGVASDQRVEGKMNVYLKRNHPEHYARLLSAHVL